MNVNFTWMAVKSSPALLYKSAKYKRDSNGTFYMIPIAANS